MDPSLVGGPCDVTDHDDCVEDVGCNNNALCGGVGALW